MSILIVMALPSENQYLHIASPDYPVLYTGVGKINAAVKLTKFLALLPQAELVALKILNLGSAGSHKYDIGSLVNATLFLQHDMNVTALGFDEMQTPFEENIAVVGERIADFPSDTCYSGDSFIVDHKGWSLIDMEGYALAKVANMFGCPFYCVKVVTDGANNDANNDWITNVEKTSAALASVVNHLE
jgi:adenosylhomocysteine nucleosidase